MKHVLILLAGFSLSLFAFSFAFAHSGRTNSSGCHNDNIHGGYHCHNGGYSAPVNNWVCKIGDQTFYSHFTALAYWNSKIDLSVKEIYRNLLERETGQGDLDYWHSKFPYNNCKASGWNSQTIFDEVKNSEEYKGLLAKKAAAKTAPVLGTSTTKSNDYIGLWIVAFIIAFYIGVGLLTFVIDKLTKK